MDWENEDSPRSILCGAKEKIFSGYKKAYITIVDLFLVL